MSNFKDTKISIEQMFDNYWSDTDIHYAGMEFDETGTEKWVQPIYEPMDMTNTSMSSTSMISEGSLYVVCWADTQFGAFEIADSILTMINSYMPSDITTTKNSMIDQGFNEAGKAFVVIRFRIKSYIGCGDDGSC